MQSDDRFVYGFRIVGDVRGERLLIDHQSAVDAYACCDPKAKCDQQAFVSAFCFGNEFRQHLLTYRSPKGYSGPTWSSWLWFDIDSDDITDATKQARRLYSYLCDRYCLDGDELLAFFSGSKGYHLGLPTAFWNPEPSAMYHKQCRSMAEMLATQCNVTIDRGVYDRVRPFRAPNSRHGKTGLYKRHLEHDELLHLSVDGIVGLASEPEPFDLPATPELLQQAADDWRKAGEEQAEAVVSQRDGPATVNRSTRDFLADGAGTGDRHRLLFSAAANLGEFRSIDELVFQLLTEPALDCGLSPSDVRRQIECGLQHKR